MSGRLKGVSHTVTAATFNRNPSQAKRRAEEGPLVITDHGEPSFVLVTAADFEAHWRPSVSVLDALEDSHGLDLDFEPPRVSFEDREIEF